MYLRRPRRVFQNHRIEDDLEKEVLAIKPKLEAIEQLEKQLQQQPDPQLQLYVSEERKKLIETINEMTKKFGVSFIDVYSKLTAEKFKNDIIEQRQKKQQRQEVGGEEEDVIDLVDENNILLQRIRGIKQQPLKVQGVGQQPQYQEIQGIHPALKPFYERFVKYQKGFKPPELTPQQQDEYHEYLKSQFGEEYAPSEKEIDILKNRQFVIPHKKQHGKLDIPHEIQRKKYIEQQMNEANKQKEQRKQFNEDIRAILFGKLRESVAKKKKIEDLKERGKQLGQEINQAQLEKKVELQQQQQQKQEQLEYQQLQKQKGLEYMQNKQLESKKNQEQQELRRKQEQKQKEREELFQEFTDQLKKQKEQKQQQKQQIQQVQDKYEQEADKLINQFDKKNLYDFLKKNYSGDQLKNAGFSVSSINSQSGFNLLSDKGIKKRITQLLQQKK